MFAGGLPDELELAGMMHHPLHLIPELNPGFMTEIPPQIPGRPPGGNVVMHRRESERVPSWSQQETREFIAIRAELERDFTQAKRNKMLWEVVAGKMRERGFRRSPEQCKCKWKNLVNRYKGKETSDPDIGRHCPFFEELHTIFTERAKNMERMLLESEVGGSSTKRKAKQLQGERSSGDFSYNEEDDEDSEKENTSSRNKKKRTYVCKAKSVVSEKSKADSMENVLQDFFQQQNKLDMQWREMMERQVDEKNRYEKEWRQSIERMERERLVLYKSWWEREEQKRNLEESRAEKRDALLTALLNRLIGEVSL